MQLAEKISITQESWHEFNLCSRETKMSGRSDYGLNKSHQGREISAFLVGCTTDINTAQYDADQPPIRHSAVPEAQPCLPS